MSTWHQVDKLANRRKKAAKNGDSNIPFKKAVVKDMDIWSTSIEEKPSTEEKLNDFIEPIIRKKAVERGARKGTVKGAERGFKAVNVAASGLSYNPRFSDHQASIQLALDQELARQADAERLAKRLSYPAELDEIVYYL
jgi:hypothetical protein